jgi:ABC-type phosphate transport system substrate-binding protein
MTHPSTHRQAPVTSRHARRAVLCLALAAWVCSTVLLDGPSAWADENRPSFVIVTHPSAAVSEVTQDFVAQAFLKRITRWPDGETIRPVDLRPDARVRSAFSGSLLKRSVAAMRSYWQQRIFSGRELPPPELDSDEAVVRYVLGNAGAIGYVSADAKLHNAKVLVLR